MVSIWCSISLYSKLIGWVIEGRKYAAAGGDQAFFMIGPWLEIVIHVLEFYLSIVRYNFDWIFVLVLISHYLCAMCSDVEYILYISQCCPNWWQW